MSKKLLKGKELDKRMIELGISMANHTVGSISDLEWKYQELVMNAERSIRDGRLWVVALVSAIASLASAVTAMVTVLQY